MSSEFDKIFGQLNGVPKVSKTWDETLPPFVPLEAYGTPNTEVPEDIEELRTAPSLISDFRVLSSKEFLADLKPLEYVIDGILPKSVVYSITGYTGHGKTTLALQMALSVAEGDEFAGRETSKGAVVIIAGENPHNLKWQYAAALAARDLESADVHFISGHFSLEAWAETARDKINKIPNIKLIVVDSLQAFFEGDNDNDNMAMVKMARQLRDLADMDAQPAMAVIAHPAGKTPSKDTLTPRGGSGFLNEIDGNLTIWSPDGKTQTLHHSQKFRGAGFEPIDFVMAEHTFSHLRDIKDEPIKLRVSRPEMLVETISKERKFMQDTEALLYLIDGGQKVTERSLAEHINSTKHAARNIINRAKDEKLIRRHAAKWVLTQGGKDFLNENSV